MTARFLHAFSLFFPSYLNSRHLCSFRCHWTTVCLAKSESNNKSVWVSDFFTPSVSLLSIILAWLVWLITRHLCSCVLFIFVNHHYFYSWFTVKSIRHIQSSYIEWVDFSMAQNVQKLLQCKMLSRLNDGAGKEKHVAWHSSQWTKWIK